MLTCAQCGREVIDQGDEFVHKDGRVKHQVILADPGTKEDEMPRTRVVSPTGDEDYRPVLSPSDPGDASLLEQAKAAFADLSDDEREMVGDAEDYDWENPITPEEPDDLFPDETANVPGAPPTDEGKRQTRVEEDIVGNDNAMASLEALAERRNPDFGKPKREDMVTVRGGGLYLTARRRISWMRGEPVPQPLWTIDTYPEEIVRGEYKSNTKVEGGYARYRANVFDEKGRLISTGTKTEWSERFMDFAEKAETGAIARALAVAGFGTEAALDLDEGYESDRIADAPVSDSRPINITPSSVGGLAQGGRSENVTQAQINEIARLIKVSAMGLTIVPFMEGVLQKSVPDLGEEPTKVISEFLDSLSFEEAAQLIQALNKAVNDA